MTKVTITVERSGENQYPIIRVMDYQSKEEAIADTICIAEFIQNYVQ